MSVSFMVFEVRFFMVSSFLVVLLGSLQNLKGKNPELLGFEFIALVNRVRIVATLK